MSAADWVTLYSNRTSRVQLTRTPVQTQNLFEKNNNKIRSPNFERDFDPEIMEIQKIYFIKNERELNVDTENGLKI